MGSDSPGLGNSISARAAAWAIVTITRWERLAARANYSNNELAALCKISIRQLERQFRKHVGCSPQTWLNQRRILAAQQMLRDGRPVKAVAFDLRYKHTSHFCQQFKLSTNMTPSEFAAGELLQDADVAET